MAVQMRRTMAVIVSIAAKNVRFLGWLGSSVPTSWSLTAAKCSSWRNRKRVELFDGRIHFRATAGLGRLQCSLVVLVHGETVVRRDQDLAGLVHGEGVRLAVGGERLPEQAESASLPAPIFPFT